MTNYELADISQSFFGNSLSAYAVFLSIVSGFLATSYIVGARLTTSQVRMLTALFCITMVFLIWSMSAYTYWGVLFALGGDADNAPSGVMLPGTWVPIVFAAINIITVAMCLIFLWNIRHPKYAQ